MRINLKCPYSEKDEAKALGAKWDADRKVWYIRDVEDLTPFSRWIPLLGRMSEDMKPRKEPKPRITGEYRPICACTSPPWEDCEHSEALAQKALDDIMNSEVKQWTGSLSYGM